MSTLPPAATDPPAVPAPSTPVPATDSHQRAAANIRLVLDHLGVDRAHFAGRGPGAEAFAALRLAAPHLLASAALVLPGPFPTAAPPLAPLGDRLLVLRGDSGPATEALDRTLVLLPASVVHVERDFTQLAWSDLFPERAGARDALLTFLDRVQRDLAVPPALLPQGEGEIDGVVYDVRGEGPPLVLLPLFLSPAQWEPVLPALAQRFCTISIGGPRIGVVALLEQRARTGYLDVVRATVEDAAPHPGESLLEVGCGTGALSRWLTRDYGAAVTAVDVNRYLLREAQRLAARAGLPRPITFREGSAEALPLPDSSFDIAFSSTVMEEVDADLMLAEMLRVTRPGGRIAVIVRAIDMPQWLALPLPAALASRINALAGAGAAAHGCADSSLYRRFHAAGLTNLRVGPRLGWTHPAAGLEDWTDGRILGIESALTPDELTIWREAVSRAHAEGLYFWANPYHCAVGTRPQR